MNTISLKVCRLGNAINKNKISHPLTNPHNGYSEGVTFLDFFKNPQLHIKKNT